MTQTIAAGKGTTQSLEMSPKPVTWNLVLLSIVLGIGGTFQYGLQVSTISSPSEYIQKFINQTWLDRNGFPLHDETLSLLWSVIISIYNLGGLLGALSVGYLSGRFGRKKTLLYNNITALLGATVLGFSKILGSFEMVMLGRFLYGVSTGLGLNVHMIYTGECAPQQLRGRITITSALFAVIGKCTGLLLSLSELLGSEDLWPLLMASSVFPALIQLVTLPFFPDPPRYLLIDKGDKEGCIQAMKKLWGDRDHKAEMDEMLAEKAAINGEKAKSVVELVCNRAVRWQFLTLLLVYGLMQLVGINVVYFYTYDVFYNAGIPSAQIRYVSLGMGITELLTIGLCAYMIDHVGRKALLWKSYSILSLTLGTLTVTLSLQKNYSWMPYFSTILIFILLLSYGIGPASVSCTLTTEIFNQSYRPAAFVFCGVLNWLGLIVLGFVFPFIVQGLGSFCFIFFLAYCLVMAIFVFLFVPETKGKSILEIMEQFQHLNFGGKKKKTDKQTDINLIFSTRFSTRF
ncbi:solute carrier family 2, facilitated glucose transporter member 11 isoform X2 [Microcaecilia unicolor]|uniref:Solute carrier family 2, facilitated glucose transporter member 5 n=1 Tax=Microcaecilia unicolor TaxID=1415580 RepID=A0A6P7Z7W4_9AMPH|nr:solute carrier family 2, facilitated glucose transporter member 11-like isoform X2 [Microcaecilia unicolor]